MTERDENAERDRPASGPRAGDDLAAEVERGETPRTPFLALTGVWLMVVAAVAIVLVIVLLTLYLV